MSELVVFLQQNWLLVLAFILVLGFIVYEEKGGASSYVRLTPQAVVHMINRKHAFIVDVRDQASYKKGHIKGAFHLPMTNFKPDNKKLLAKKDKPLILVSGQIKDCLSVFSALKKAGFTQVYILKGGISAWKKDQLPLVDG